MNLTFLEFINYAIQNPILLMTFGLVVALMFFSGGTVASDSIAVCVGTRSLSFTKTTIVAIFCNFLGVLVMTIFNAKVAQTMFNMANFSSDGNESLVALMGGLLAVVIWMGATVLLGLPGSNSHIMIASISGAAIAINGFGALNLNSWKLVFIGLAISTIAGFIVGNLVAKIVEKICKNMNRIKTIPFFKFTQVIGAGASAFMDGAQDGQKAIGVCMLAIAFGTGTIDSSNFSVPLWLMFLCAFAMSCGTIFSAYKMIKNVGVRMLKLEPYQGTCADISNFTCSFIASSVGIPMSITHTKISSMMGVGASRSIKKINWLSVKNMLLSWVIVFPGCTMLAFIITTVIFRIIY